ncbi:dynactin subunit 6 [Lingula anatina]|uniref:Dynactin subunit 6 n=1 Tax=Lingula anatina TaxID=7574 RepID=A0A1S3HHZ1_LINAN|nr:dynactin subunit 6 [Lingula anatina]|eukprot:XP_013385637.1 dynactin subunit 6 [Lingula anatina]
MAAVPAKSSLKIAQGAVVCNECELKGDITIGAKTVIHPKAKIIADAGPIIIGDNNLIEEQVEIINRKVKTDGEGSTHSVMIIGNNNVFEVGSCILLAVVASSFILCLVVTGGSFETPTPLPSVINDTLAAWGTSGAPQRPWTKMAAVPAKSSLKIAQGAVVCNECELKGDITIGAKTVIHPKAKIIADAGPIIIGDNNLIEEQVEIINRKVKTDGEGSTHSVMIIGNNNVFEVGSYSEALNMGDNNIIECKAHIGRETTLTNGCIVGAMCHVTSREVLPENTVMHGSKCERRVQAERPAPQTLQLDFLTKILPNYHHLKKSSKALPKVS